MLPIPKLELAARLRIDLGAPKEMGAGRGGTRRIIPILGGRVEGPHFQGKVLGIGADWQTVFSDGLAQLDTRYSFETDDGAVIEILNFGHRHGPSEVLDAVARGEDVDPGAYYMRTHARLETGDARYAWVNKALFLGVGGRQKASVTLDLYQIL